VFLSDAEPRGSWRPLVSGLYRGTTAVSCAPWSSQPGW